MDNVEISTWCGAYCSARCLGSLGGPYEPKTLVVVNQDGGRSRPVRYSVHILIFFSPSTVYE